MILMSVYYPEIITNRRWEVHGLKIPVKSLGLSFNDRGVATSHF